MDLTLWGNGLSFIFVKDGMSQILPSEQSKIEQYSCKWSGISEASSNSSSENNNNWESHLTSFY